MKTTRRNFAKTLLAAPFVAASLNSLASVAPSENKKSGHKFKISLNVYSFNQPLRDGEIDLFDVLFFCAKYNFDAIDPTGYYFPGYPAVPPDDFMMTFKRQAFLLGLDISGTGVRNDFANPDKKSRDADIKMIKEWIQAAAKMGIPNIRVFAGTNPHEGFTRDQVFEWMAADLKTCCNFAKDYGVIVAIQNHNDFLKTAADVDRIFDMVDSDWLGLNLDIGSYRQSDPYNEIEKNIKYAVTWQIKENVWINGQETPTDFEKLFRIIKESGYRGYLPLETLGEGDPLEKIPVLLEKVKKAIETVES
ncbi:MAG: sugar phosphate isomerase/epimerase [Prolixibacteraceae bacterium]|nr:sugar phosphate isomerase/epimerase [Prolixibacteraceae bacterium]